MAAVAITMNALAVPFGGEVCCGCGKSFARAERMNGMEYSDGSPAGWHCDSCVEIWKTHGEDRLPRWGMDEPFPDVATFPPDAESNAHK